MKVEKALSIELKKLFSEIANRFQGLVNKYTENVKLDSLDTELYAQFLQMQDQVNDDDEAYSLTISAITEQIYKELAEQLANDVKKQLEKYSGDLPFIPFEMISQLQKTMESELQTKFKYYRDTYFTKFQNLIDKRISGKITDPDGIKGATINGKEITLSPDGSFAVDVELEKGPNLIQIRAEDKDGVAQTLFFTIQRGAHHQK